MAFYNLMFLAMSLTDLTSSAKLSDLSKMTFSNSVQLKMIETLDNIAFLKISAVFETQNVIKNDFF